MQKDKLWIMMLFITIFLLCVDVYIMLHGYPQKIISIVGIACFICTGATVLLKNLRF